MSQPSCKAVARALCEATLAMHAEGVIHRDVKPDNVLLTSAAAGSPGYGCRDKTNPRNP
jgi:serine/threonine protein kinase